ncbi:MAG: 50S ribosome-binding protein YggL [Verrucomicrobia bacterium]|nr:50S ribosome-binding protein YggL [Verrucomicrobiota bacterium]
MRKRLRKKKHLGEFRQMGFTADCQMRPGLSGAEFDQFTDEFIVQAIEAHGLVFGGGGSPERGWSGVVCRDDRYDSTTDVEKAAVQHWLEQRSEIESFRLSEFWDVWHGPDPFDTEDAEPDATREPPPCAPASDVPG